MAFVFVFCVHVTPSILRAVGLLSVCVPGSMCPRVSGALSSQICELVNKITFDIHLYYIHMCVLGVIG